MFVIKQECIGIEINFTISISSEVYKERRDSNQGCYV